MKLCLYKKYEKTLMKMEGVGVHAILGGSTAWTFFKRAFVGKFDVISAAFSFLSPPLLH